MGILQTFPNVDDRLDYFYSLGLFYGLSLLNFLHWSNLFRRVILKVLLGLLLKLWVFVIEPQIRVSQNFWDFRKLFTLHLTSFAFFAFNADLFNDLWLLFLLLLLCFVLFGIKRALLPWFRVQRVSNPWIILYNFGFLQLYFGWRLWANAFAMATALQNFKFFSGTVHHLTFLYFVNSWLPKLFRRNLRIKLASHFNLKRASFSISFSNNLEKPFKILKGNPAINIDTKFNANIPFPQEFCDIDRNLSNAFDLKS